MLALWPLVLLALAQPTPAAAPQRDHVFAALADGRLARVEAAAPWSVERSFAWIGPEPRVRAVGGLVVGLSAGDATLCVFDAPSGTELRRIELGRGVAPADVHVRSTSRAYVSDAAGAALLRVDLRSGSVHEAVDLSPFADADGNPDMGRMIAWGNLLFVQLQRRDLDAPPDRQPTPMLAVISLSNEALVDADPQRPGVQAIELVGTAPKCRMHLEPAMDKLYVGATGAAFDEGGLEQIDVRLLRSEGLIVAERDSLTGADLGPFVFTGPAGGYLASTTDLLPSTHFKPFTVAGGADTGPDLVTVVGYFAPELLHDPARRHIWIPAVDGLNQGLLVFDAENDVLLTGEIIELGSPVVDLDLGR